MLRVLAPAKLNLHLEILAREVDGYHQLETLFCALELADELELEQTAGGVELSVEGDTPATPPGLGAVEENLVYLAAQLFLRETGVSGGVRIKLRKRIPVGAGLGGGSSDAAATLLALDRMHREPLGGAGRLRLAAALGSDVPFFLCGSLFALAWGRGGRLLPLEPLPSLPVLLLVPEQRMSTARAFAELDQRRRDQPYAATPRVWRADQLGDWDYLARHARNDFESVAFASLPELDQAKATLSREGALLALLTGSGSTVYGIFRELTRLQRALAALQLSSVRTLITRTACPPSPPPFG